MNLSYFVAMREDLRIAPERDGWVGLYRAKPSTAFHSHEELEYNLVTRGSCSYLVGERRYDLHRGSLIWLFPDQEHVLINPSPDCEMWIVVLRPEALRRAVRVGLDPRLLERNPPWLLVRPLVPAAFAAHDRLLHQLHGHHDQLPRTNAGLPYALLDAWAAFHDAQEADDGANAVDPLVDLAARLLSRADAPEDLVELAARVGLSPARLSRRFNRQLGVGIADYRNRIRLERFLERYGPGTTLLDAALAAGFGSYAQFHRVFHQVLGVAPRVYLSGAGSSPATGQGPVNDKANSVPRRRTRKR